MSILAAILLSVNFLTSHPITGQANMSVLVQNLTTGEVIDSYRADHVVPPASVMKLLTTGAALETLGPGFRFPTVLEYSGEIEKGRLHGNLYIRGGCDPSLGWKGRTAFLNQWVRAIRQAGICAIDGAVIADMSMLDGEAQNPGWLCEDAGNYYAPGIFALNYYGNTMNIVLRSDAPGTVAVVTGTEPKVEGLRFINHVRCDKIAYDGAFVSGLPYSNERYLTGAVPSNLGTFGIKGDLPNPGLLLAQHLTAKLREAGVPVACEAAYEADYNPLTPPRKEVYIHYSAPLSELIQETNINSNNLYAEALFRYLGTRYTLPGTIHNSQEFLREYWRRRGVTIQNAIIKDGCGLAPQDAVSAKAFVQLLTVMSRSPEREAWMASLPVSGQTGTLRSLCAQTALEGRIHAKSGTIAGTKNFAGYIDMPNGDTWVFAILINSAPGKAKNIQTVIQQYLLDVYKKHQ
ncbi:MAG: D-alanyl-D-alanine carboxypeptidase/D-alanyl-D-alanine-endopeptidase [Paludibacteraceae bacterium]|jgi:D-alanyl-D-alanine carboxypeptidase/D-alanyl-D-alanine-endopeptidase (penicillin-binding protein 4)|nr:D-alanyl-D-alanine carboxypeptidase/D-alanyl-D-alanine-endopeptidase [Paludibacteraceae bacterium]